MYLDTSSLSAQDNYRHLVGGVTPRPIAWISSLSADGVSNLAPYSFFTVASCNPPVLMYTQVMPRHGRNKDTLENILATGSCVVNIVSAALLEQMNATCANFPAEVSEFAAAGIEACASRHVAAPGVAASDVRYECTLRDVVRLSAEPMGGTVVLLDVRGIYIADQVAAGAGIDQQLLDTVGKLGGDWYALTRERRALARP